MEDDASADRAAETAAASWSAFVRAGLWMLGALTAFSLVAIAGREASRGMSTLEILFWRSSFSMLILLAASPLVGGIRAYSSRVPMLHVARNVFHMTGQYCWFYALTLIPLAQLFALEFTTPLWVVLLAPMLVGERLTGLRLGAALLGFVGAVVAAKPGGLKIEPGAGYALLCAVLFAMSIVMVKRIVRTDGIWPVLFNMAWMQALTSFVILLPWLRLPGAASLGWVFVVGLTGTCAHLALTRALTLADAMLVAPLDFLRLPLIAVLGALIYAERLDAAVLAGGAVIVAANMLNIWAERKGRVRVPR